MPLAGGRGSYWVSLSGERFVISGSEKLAFFCSLGFMASHNSEDTKIFLEKSQRALTDKVFMTLLR
jgi:hypothetical protein